MNWFGLICGLAVAGIGHAAFAKHRLTDPVKIARTCKAEVEQFCRDVRPGRQRLVTCLRKNTADLSPLCLSAVKSAE